MRRRTRAIALAGWLVAMAMPAGAMLAHGSVASTSRAGDGTIAVPLAGMPEVLPIFLVGTGLLGLSVAVRRTT